jgi:hypothetical protein
VSTLLCLGLVEAAFFSRAINPEAWRAEGCRGVFGAE